MPGDDGGKEGGKEGGQQEGGARKGGRGKARTFPELMCCMYAVLGPGYQREIQLWQGHSCPSVNLELGLHAACQVDERTRQVERPTWQARDRSHARRIHPALRQGDHHEDQGHSDIVPTRKSGQGVP